MDLGPMDKKYDGSQAPSLQALKSEELLTVEKGSSSRGNGKMGTWPAD